MNKKLNTIVGAVSLIGYSILLILGRELVPIIFVPERWIIIAWALITGIGLIITIYTKNTNARNNLFISAMMIWIFVTWMYLNSEVYDNGFWLSLMLSFYSLSSISREDDYIIE